ncbi:MAG: ATP synthase F1 subunit gamma [Alphaproteobacteria bacterium]|nr:ATP synthase F1 subunit gamma [Alphaproteobacteria bacterium]
MPNLKDIRTRIDSVKKTKQITSAMKLVAAAKLRRASERATAARPYRDQLEAVLRRVAGAAGDEIDEPLLQPRETVSKVLVVVVTSDRGLCGAFNNGLLRHTWDWLQAKKATGATVDVQLYGRKGQAFFRRMKQEVKQATTDYARTPKMEIVEPLTASMVAGFVDGEYDEVWLVYNRFVSNLVQTPTYDRVLPLSVEGKEEDASAEAAGEYRYEPDAAEILGELLPLFLQTLVLGCFLETEAGFFAAQMTAMDSATRNASDLIGRLTLEYNRARQAAITKEIIEIVSGAAAL